jgi:Cu2+-exporting ATPase
LIKDAESLEMVYKLNAIVLDKTGTITEGKPSVAEIRWQDESETGMHRDVLLSIEKSSEHPLADAVVRYLDQGAPLLALEQVESVAGKGITAAYQGLRWWVGNARLLKEFGFESPAMLNEEANTIVFFGNEQKLLAVLVMTDRVKDNSVLVVSELQELGIEVYMLTGDNAQTADAVAKRVGIEQYSAEMMPSDKADFVKELRRQGKVVGMVGDGINDSEALALADVSVAMGRGSDIAMDVAKITLIGDELTKIPYAIKLSRRTVRTIRQNLFWAFVYNVIAIPVAAGVLYPVNGFMLNPMIAGALMALSSVSVVSNSLRLRWS